jgi:hypothetical protein
MTMSTEKEWVEILRADIEKVMKQQNVSVWTGVRLPYQINVASYAGKDAGKAQDSSMKPRRGYQTDMLLAEQSNNNSGDWVPRVVVEFKLLIRQY